jgi:hypothetical protein
MTCPENNFWSDMVGRMRRVLGLAPSTPAEADRQMREVQPAPMSKSELDALLHAALASAPPSVRVPDAPSWEPEEETSHIEEDVLQLNRNRGEAPGGRDELTERLRREALADEPGDDDDGRE